MKENHLNSKCGGQRRMMDERMTGHVDESMKGKMLRKTRSGIEDGAMWPTSVGMCPTSVGMCPAMCPTTGGCGQQCGQKCGKTKTIETPNKNREIYDTFLFNGRSKTKRSASTASCLLPLSSLACLVLATSCAHAELIAKSAC